MEIDQNLKDNIAALTFVSSDKFLTEAEISEIWRDYKMVKILKYAEEQGKKKGKEEGKIEGRINRFFEALIYINSVKSAGWV